MNNGYYGNILEEELKNKVAQDLFEGFDTTQIIGRIDFCVSIPADPLGLNEAESLLWAEAKKGTSHDIYESFIQLILTLGKERPQDTILPPAFLGAFDAEKMAFLPYSTILDVLRQNDFNWNVAPSDHTTKEFKQLQELLNDALHHGLEIYNYEKDAKELVYFIKKNFTLRKIGVRHIRINKNNFTHIYLKWLEAVKPTININWEIAKQAGIYRDFSAAKGELRKLNVTAGLGGKSYISYLKVPARLAAFCEELNRRRKATDANDIAAIYELSFWVHFELVTIHPWADRHL